MPSRATGPLWEDPVRWAALCDGTLCPICRQGKPRDVVAEFPTSWATAPPKAPLPGYVSVVSKRHVVEPFQLPAEERAQFWEDVLFVAEILDGLFRPIKMNYEIHGNTIPHLHLHLYPRAPNDPFVGRAIEGAQALFTRSRHEIDLIRRALAAVEKRKRTTAGRQ